MRVRSLLIVSAALLTGFAPAPLPKPIDKKAALKELQGRWKMQESTFEGRVAGLPTEALTIDQNRMWYTQFGTDLGAWDITIDATKTPPWINQTGGGREYKGIYRLEGKKLTILMREGKAESCRPIHFDVKKEGVHAMVLTRD